MINSVTPRISQADGKHATEKRSAVSGQRLVILNSLLIAFVITALIFIAHTQGNAQTPAIDQHYPVLAACSGSALLFSKDPEPIPSKKNGTENEKNKIEKWRDLFDENVSEIVTAHLDPGRLTVSCTEQSSRVQPSAELLAIAKDLPPWRKGSDLLALSEMDMGAVLLEYLRVYECSLKEHLLFMPGYLERDLRVTPNLNLEDVYTVEDPKRRRQIQDELVLARKAIERTLAVTGSADRLRPLDTNFECLQRSSLDIRNILGLAADTTACMPRVWDARGSLRDIQP